jgi:hypothetical protein
MRFSPTTANALRTITVANMVVLSMVGAMLAVWMERPAGLVFGGLCAATVVGLFFVLPLLDPYRNEPGWDPASSDTPDLH